MNAENVLGPWSSVNGQYAKRAANCTMCDGLGYLPFSLCMSTFTNDFVDTEETVFFSGFYGGTPIGLQIPL